MGKDHMRLSVSRHRGCWRTAPTLCALIAYSSNAFTLSEKDFLSELPVVLSASRLAQPKHEAPAAITVIDRAMIEASTALDISDLLRLVPGFQVGQVSGSERSITSHGLADQLGRRMQVLVDGRSVYDPVFGGALWQSLPLSLADVERIEVARGPNAASFGANAFLGTINIITREAGLRPYGRAVVTVGDEGTRQADVAENWVLGKHRLRLSAGQHQSDGFTTRHDSSASSRVNARYQNQLSPRDALDIQMGFRESTVQLGFPDDAESPERDTRLQHHFQQLHWHHLLEDGSDFSAQLYHSYQSNRDAYDYSAIPGTFIDFGFVAQRYDAELQWRFSPSANSRMVLGGGWRLDQGQAEHALFPDADTTRNQYRLFAHGEQRLSDQWLLQAGAMAESFDGVGRYLSPRLSLNYSFLSRQALRLGVARGYRIPGLFEQDANFGVYSRADGSEVFIDYITPADLKAESIVSYEVGLVGDLRSLRTQYDIKFFRHHMENLIDTVRVDPAPSTNARWHFRNSGQMDLYGVEMQLDMKPTARTDLHIAWSYADPSGEKLRRDTGGVQQYANLRTRAPKHTLGVLLRQRLNAGWSASANWTYVDPMVWGGEGDDQGRISRIDLKLGRSLRLFGSAVRFDFLVQNLLDKQYYDFYVPKSYRTGNLFDRRLYAQVVVNH